MDLELNNCFPTSPIGASPNAKRKIAPTRAIIQYVPTLIFPIFKFGKNKIDKVINTNVIEAISIVGIIKKPNDIIELFFQNMISKFDIFASYFSEGFKYC